MRKIIILLSCVVILVSSALMVSAEGYGDGDVRYSDLPFDSITFDDDITFPYMGNSMAVGTDWGSFTFDEHYSGHNSLVYESALGVYVGRTTFKAPAEKITLKLSECLLFFKDPDSLGQVDDRPLGHIYSLSHSDFEIGEIVLSGSYYLLDGYESTDNFTVGTKWNVFEFTDASIKPSKSIGQLLFTCLESHGITSDSYGVYITDLSVDIYLERYDVNTPAVMIESVFSYLKPQFSSFVYDSNIHFAIPKNPAVAKNFDTMTWLLNCVDAFMNFEIFPGFSFNSLLTLVLCIGVLLWFIKLIS